MLTDSARTWLNSLAPNNINAWTDFEKVFIRNFNGTYKRPGMPRDLSLCVQGDRESERAYLARWTELRNSCEGVVENQAIGFFIEGCRQGMMMCHRLLCDDPKSMADLLTVTDK